MTIDDIDKSHDFVLPAANTNIIKVIGVGGGGNNAVRHMYEQGIKDVSFVVCNTDRQALIHSPVPNKLQIGSSGLGAGNVPEVAREAAEESAEAIKEMFEDNTQMVFITAGMGGGTGTGAAPVVARLAREKGLLTVGIVTIPFLFEGQRKIIKALEGANEMSKYVDALLVINNERLNEIYPDLEFMNAFGKADDTLSIAARGISELITAHGVINIDFKDVNTTLRNGGASIISIGYGEGEHRVTKAINDALNSPLLKDRDIMGSKRILFNIYFNPNAEQKFMMGESTELTDFITSIDNSVDVIWGVAHDETLGNEVKITLLAAGFETTARVDGRTGAERKVIGSTPAATATAPTPKTQSEETVKKIVEEYGAGKAVEIFKTRDKQKIVVLTRQQFNDDATIEQFENNPTYTRDRRTVDAIKNTMRPQPEPAQSEPGAPAGAEAPRSESRGGTRIDFN